MKTPFRRVADLKPLIRLAAVVLLSPMLCAQVANSSQQLAFAGLRSVAQQGQINGIQTDSAGNIYLLLNQGDGVRLLKTDNSGSAVLAQSLLGGSGDVGTAIALGPAGRCLHHWLHNVRAPHRHIRRRDPQPNRRLDKLLRGKVRRATQSAIRDVYRRQSNCGDRYCRNGGRGIRHGNHVCGEPASDQQRHPAIAGLRKLAEWIRRAILQRRYDPRLRDVSNRGERRHHPSRGYRRRDRRALSRWRDLRDRLPDDCRPCSRCSVQPLRIPDQADSRGRRHHIFHIHSRCRLDLHRARQHRPDAPGERLRRARAIPRRHRRHAPRADQLPGIAENSDRRKHRLELHAHRTSHAILRSCRR